MVLTDKLGCMWIEKKKQKRKRTWKKKRGKKRSVGVPVPKTLKSNLKTAL